LIFKTEESNKAGVIVAQNCIKNYCKKGFLKGEMGAIQFSQAEPVSIARKIDILYSGILFLILEQQYYLWKEQKMVILSYGTIRDYSGARPDAADSLNIWYRVTEQADWANFNELRSIFGSADAVGNDLYVFNIKGNHYRLIARIIFKVRTVYIRFIGTHAEYDKVNLNDL
jgi:mRNA interferase HigB